MKSVAGVPGKIKKTLGDEDRKMILKYAQNYLDYTQIYLAERTAHSTYSAPMSR